MKTVLGLLSFQEGNQMLMELAERRAVESMPIGGRYRLMDFSLSSMVNSGVNSVGIMLPDVARSVLDHLRSGKEWDLARRHGGLFYLPSLKKRAQERIGDLKNYYHNLDFIEHSNYKYVVLARASFIYNLDFEQVLRFHQNTGADITMVYYNAEEEAVGRNVVLDTADTGLVHDIAEKPAIYQGNKISMNIYLMERRVFVEMVRYAYEHGGQSLLMDGIIHRAHEYEIYAFEHTGYVAHIDSTASYYKANMDMLRSDVWRELFMGERPIYTKIKDEVPVQYKDTADVKSSLIANGCIVRGKVDGSVLFRGVTVGKGATVKNSILMQKCIIEDGAVVENVICDKNVAITKDKWLKGAPNYPLIVTKNVVI